MKNIAKIFNNLIQKTIFKVQNKTNSKFKISNFNKYLITFIGLSFLYLFYLLIPLLYDKGWVQNTIENKIFNEYKINLSTSANISYRILPAPHFLIKNSKITLDGTKNQKFIADVKNLKIFLGQKNLFNKKKINIKELNIDNANFFLLRSDFKKLNELSNNQFAKKKIIISNSNIFFKDNLDEIITIIKIDKAIYFFDDKKKLNLFNLKGSTFGVPFVFDFTIKNDSVIKKKANIEVKSLNLNIFNEFIHDHNSPLHGKNIISFPNTVIKTKYNMKEKLITFVSDNSQFSDSRIDYSGELLINPFNLDLNINLGNYKISKLFNLNFLLNEFITSELLFNENLSLDLSILARTDSIQELFHKAEINFNIVNSKINLDNTMFINDKIGLLELDNSNLFVKNNKLILNTDILITIKDSKHLFSTLNTNKKSRKEIKNILINLNYNFFNNLIKFNKIKIDNNDVSDQLLIMMEGFNDNNINNIVRSRQLINKILSIYEG
tara:strand:- start:422 stop:1906 length:1485 start_codon:yes stop_codon:yes gene_type:complete